MSDAQFPAAKGPNAPNQENILEAIPANNAVKTLVARFDPTGSALPAARLRKMSREMTEGGSESTNPPVVPTPQTPPTPDSPNLMPYTPDTPHAPIPYTPDTPNTPSVVKAGGFQTPQLLSKKALALAAGNRVPVGHPSTRPPRPPPPVSPPPTFSKRHSVRLSKPAQKATTLSVVECAAYDLFDSRVMRVVNGWKVIKRRVFERSGELRGNAALIS